MKRALPYLTLAATIYMIIGSFIMVSIFGFNVNTDANQPPVRLFLEPAGYAFIIWAFIYIGYILLGIYQLAPKLRTDPKFVKARPYIIINAFANSIWFVGVAQNQLWLTVICMLTLLFTLIQLAIILELGQAGQTTREKLMVKLPIALYFGWVTVATPINTTAFLLAEVGWTGGSAPGPELWSIAIMFVAFSIILYLFLNKKVNVVYLLVGVWGLFAIFIANLSFSNLVAFTALGLALALFTVIFNPINAERENYSLL